MNNVWQLQDAKNKFSAVVKEALEHGPQTVTLRNVTAVVVLSFKDYKKLMKPKKNLVDFFKESPLAEYNIDFSRKKDHGRKLSL